MCAVAIDINVDALQKDIIIAGMVDTIQGRVAVPEVKEHQWSCTLTPVTENEKMYELKLSVTDSKFTTRPSLFIAVLDRSGSMGGAPERQVSTALKHIYALAQGNPCVKLVMVTYGSEADIIDTPDQYRIRGGTNFRAAFDMVKTVLRGYRCSDAPEHRHAINNVCGVTIAFLTDGQDMSGNKNRLVPEFKEMLDNVWGENPLSVHAIGFSRNCDQNLLEGMREAGRDPGMYRYAEPGDNDDALCNKLTGIFEVSSKASSVPVTLEIPTIQGEDEHEILLGVDSKKYGEYREWFHAAHIDGVLSVYVNSAHDDHVHIPIVKTKPKTSVTERWLGHLVDEMAGEILELSESKDADVKELHCALVQQRIEVIEDATYDDALINRLTLLKEQLELLRCNAVVNVGKLNDAKYGSRAGTVVQSAQTTYVSIPLPRQEQKVLDDQPYNEQPLRRYNRNNANSGRSPLQEAIMTEVNKCETLSKDLLSNFEHRDNDGNNALHLAAYCGHASIVKQLLALNKFDVEAVNGDNETAVSLCIKARGFHHTLGALLDAGASIPRRKSLERFAMENGYVITAKIISSYGDGSVDVDTTMTLEYVDFTYERAINSGKEIDPQQYLRVYLHHRDVKMAEKMILTHDAYPTIDMLLDLCIPKKADDPKTDEYIDLATLVLTYAPELIKEKSTELESPLFVAANRGSLPHVKLFISKGAVIDDPNEKGNTPLWMAAYKRYPCIIDELLDEGADIDYTNIKGNGPITGVCERGLVKVAEQLMARGADITKPNVNGDTYILICCRNGQWEVLKYLLDHVTEEFVNFKAHIDGFNAIMASAEQNRAECIRVLFEYGIDINQVTDDDNKILPRATPLHIASYYNRGDAVKMLLKLGADPNLQDMGGYTPLHIAVIQGHVDIVRSLRRGGALSTEDKSGNRPQAYCRNRPELRKVLVDPALDVLMRLAKGGFSDTKSACEVLTKYSGVEGFALKRKTLDIIGDDGSSPLQQAVIHSNFDVVKTMVEMGANKHGCEFWATFTRNPRIRKLIGYDLDIVVPKNALLFLGKAEYYKDLESSIGRRMEDLINAVIYNQDRYPVYRQSIECDPNHRFMREKLDLPPKALWDARVFVAKFLYDNPDTRLSPEQLMAIALYTNNNVVANIINTRILGMDIPDHAKYLLGALENVDCFKGEVYMASVDVDRKLFEIGHEFSWPRFVSCSSLWRVATENCPYYTTKARKGTVFAIKSKTGRHVGKYSVFGFDAEVLFTPYTKFKVVNWFRGDVIALGQANIREHSFALEEEDIDRMRQNNRSLIIELEEM
jgi:ankyrin repeat protein